MYGSENTNNNGILTATLKKIYIYIYIYSLHDIIV